MAYEKDDRNEVCLSDTEMDKSDGMVVRRRYVELKSKDQKVNELLALAKKEMAWID
jgi:hypothetical protein